MALLQFISRLIDIVWEYWHRDEMTITQMKRMRGLNE